MEKIYFKHEQINKDKLVDDLMESPILRNFFMDNDLTSEFIQDNLLEFMNYNTEKNRCIECKGLDTCKQDNRGFEPVIFYRNSMVKRNYKKCTFFNTFVNQANDETLIDAMHLPSSILEASLEDFDFKRGKNKTVVHNKMMNFLTKYKRGEKPKGLYLWGQNNVGKTYCLSALAKELMKSHVNVVIAYYPDLVREFKSRVYNNSVEPLISKLKQVEVLMLDDIGGEGDSVWVRDEVLGPILQYRLLDNKATFFSSNYSRKQLNDLHFSEFRDNNKTKSVRIVRRITSLTKNDNEDFQIEM